MQRVFAKVLGLFPRVPFQSFMLCEEPAQVDQEESLLGHVPSQGLGNGDVVLVVKLVHQLKDNGALGRPLQGGIVDCLPWAEAEGDVCASPFSNSIWVNDDLKLVALGVRLDGVCEPYVLGHGSLLLELRQSEVEWKAKEVACLWFWHFI